MAYLFNMYIYAPILSVLIFIYQYIAFHDLGVAIILLTILVRVVLFPIFFKSAKDQALMQRIQPHILEIQEKHKNDKEAQAKALMSLYQEHKLNPFSGFFLLLLQLPIVLALFQIFTKGLATGAFDSNSFLGLIDLGAKSIVIAIIAAALQYFQGKLALAPARQKKGEQKENAAAAVGKAMVIVGPGITLIILINLPAALGLYWVVTTAFSVVQQVYINRALNAAPETNI